MRMKVVIPDQAMQQMQASICRFHESKIKDKKNMKM